MGDTPWQGDACSLVQEFRSGRRSPAEELAATFDAIDASDLNAFCFVDRDAAIDAAGRANVDLPFGGVPIGVKELDAVKGWPDTHASVPLKEQISGHTSTMVDRLRGNGGAVLVGQTTASEFGGVNLTRTKLHGTTHNPWQHDRTPGGSSGGTAAAVAGGLCTLATGGDGGGSIRIPAGFTGLVGLKSTIGRIPRGPWVTYGNLTVTIGCLSRSVRDTARWFDVANGFDARDPLSLPKVEVNEAMARIFDPSDGVDFVITASNPDVAFAADGPLPGVFGGLDAGAGNNGRLTFPANLHGNPAISVPAGTLDGLPIGLQIVGRHYSEVLLLDLALTMERNRPWPLVAPGSPR